MDSRVETFSNLAKNLMNIYGCIVYGGFVREKLRYNYCGEFDTNDIDIYTTKKKCNAIINGLLLTYDVSNTETTIYINPHRSYVINNLHGFDITLDFNTDDDYDDVDFDVNSLTLLNNSLKNMSNISIMTIITHIIKKEFEIISKTFELLPNTWDNAQKFTIKNKKTEKIIIILGRLCKMQNKGWKCLTSIPEIFKTLLFTLDNQTTFEEVCLICQDDITEKYNMKTSCCSNIIHPKCFGQFIRQNNEKTKIKCWHCRGECFPWN